MAIYNGRILMRKGNEADFDPSKLMSGEWAVSLDAGIVRICLEAGKVIRMATYEAFEEDMKQIEAILLECQSIEEAVRRINTEVSEKLNACAEYVQQAKSYSEQAKTSEANSKSYMQSAKTSEANAKVSETNAKASENSAKEYENSAKLTEERAREVFESIPEDYSTISNDLYELAIKETASGEEIHVNDSANVKLREFALYGKAEQNTTQGNQLFDTNNMHLGGNEVEILENGYSITVRGGTNYAYSNARNEIDISKVKGKKITVKYDSFSYSLEGVGSRIQVIITKESESTEFVTLASNKKTISISENATAVNLGIYTNNTANKLTEENTVVVKGLIVSLDENAEWEPYTNGASPNPQYPQPIEVSGASGSVEVKSCGKNFLPNTNTIQTIRGVEFATNDRDKSIKVKGTNNDTLESTIIVGTFTTNFSGIVKLTGSTNEKVHLYAYNDSLKQRPYKDETKTELQSLNQDINNKEVTFYVEKGEQYRVNCRVQPKNSVDAIVYPMVSLEGGEYEPHQEPTTATIPTPNGLAGIKVSSNGNYTDSNGQQWICDEIVKYADGSGKHIQRVLKNVFDGSEDEQWSQLGSEFGFRYKSLLSKNVVNSDKSNGVFSMNSSLQPTNYGGTNSKQNSYTITNSAIYVSLSGPETLEEIKEYLSTKPMTVLATLAEPIETPLTAEEIAEIEKLQTFYPVTNISNDFDCGMSVTYYADSKNYIDKKISELATAMVNNI